MGGEVCEVLLVEDNPRDVFVMREIVADSRQITFELTHEASLAAAIGRLRTQRFDLVLLDLTLPDSSGYSTFTQLREACRNTPLILMTAVNDEEIAARAVREGAQDYLVKGSLTCDLVLRAMRHALERSRAEGALRESHDRYESLQNRYQAILRSVPSGICMLTPLWRISFANLAMTRLLCPERECQSSDLVGTELSIFFSSIEEFEHFHEASLSAVRHGGSAHQEVELVALDGRTLSCEVSLVRVDPAAAESGYVLTAVDMTDRKRSHRERETLSSLALQISGAKTVEQLAWFVHEATRRIWSWSGFTLATETGDGEFQSVVRVLGNGRSKSGLSSIQFRTRGHHLLHRAMEKGEGVLAEFGPGCEERVLPWLPEHPTSGGSFIAAPVRVGKTTVGILALSSDRVSGGFRQDDAASLQRMADVIGPALERCRGAAERMRLAAAVEQSSDAISIADKNWVIQYVNPAFEQMTGYRREEVLGRRTRTVLSGGDYDRLFFAAIAETLSRGESWNGRLKGQRKDGTTYEEKLTVVPLRDESGQITHYLSSRRDITREQELEGQVRQKQKMEAIGMLAGGIAHDFNNILQVVVGHASMLLLRTDEKHPFRDELERMLAAGKRGAALTHQLLAFSRKQQLEPQVVSIQQVLSGLEPMLQRVVDEDIQLFIDTESTTGLISVDPGQLVQVVLNLVVNARDAMPDGGRLEIFASDVELEKSNGSRSALAPGSYVVLTVTDSGCGMPQEVRDRAFEPFFTTKAIGSGTGLGLSTVYGIVKQSGGEIDLESAPGEGTCFRIYFPRVQGRTASVPTVSDPDRGQTGGGETVLLVEDQTEVRLLISSLLQSLGYSVLVASNGAEALLVAQNHDGPIHLLLTDVVMPELSGPRLIEELKTTRPDTRVLMMSGYTDRALSLHTVSMPGVPLLQKPFEPELLISRIREILDATHVA